MLCFVCLCLFVLFVALVYGCVVWLINLLVLFYLVCSGALLLVVGVCYPLWVAFIVGGLVCFGLFTCHVMFCDCYCGFGFDLDFVTLLTGLDLDFGLRLCVLVGILF